MTIGQPDAALAGSPAVRAGNSPFLSSRSAPDIGDDSLRFCAEEQTTAVIRQTPDTPVEARTPRSSQRGR